MTHKAQHVEQAQLASSKETESAKGKSEKELAHKQALDDLLTNTFNAVLRIEEQSISSRLTQGLTIAELHTLVAIGLHEKNPMKVVAERLNIRVASLTAAINKLEAKGFVERYRSEKDRRQVLVSLTTRGRKAFRAHERFHKRLVDDVLETLTDDEERVFMKALSTVKTFFDRMDQENEQYLIRGRAALE